MSTLSARACCGLLCFFVILPVCADTAWQSVTQAKKRGEVSSYVREVAGHAVKSVVMCVKWQVMRLSHLRES